MAAGFELRRANRSVCDQAAEAVGNEKVLNLSIKSLTRFPKNMLQLHTLEVLYLDYNALMQLPDDFFVVLPHLRWVDLSNNFLTSLPFRGLASQHMLRGLLVANNRIEYLPVEIALVENLSMFTCHGNPLIFPPKDISPINTKELFDYLRCFKKTDNPNRKQAKQRQKRQARQFQSKHALLPPIGLIGKAAPTPRRCGREDEVELAEPEPEDYTTKISREYNLEEWFKTMKLNYKNDDDEEEEKAAKINDKVPEIKSNPPNGVDEILLELILQNLRCEFHIPETPDSLEDKPLSRDDLIKQTLKKMYDIEKQIRYHVGCKHLRRKQVSDDPEGELTQTMYEALGYEDLHTELATLHNNLERL